MKVVKVAIVGSGPAGYTAAIYAARAKLEPTLFEGFYSGPAGGQLMTTTDVENYPGFSEGITGPALMEECRKQAARFGTEILTEDVKNVDLSCHPFLVEGAKTKIKAHALIVATGATAKRLEIPGAGDGELWQKGISACAVCDGAMPLFRDKELYVIGGGDSAVEEAVYLTKYASKVYIVHRRDELRASKIMAERALNHPKVELLWHSVISRVVGKEFVEKVMIKNVEDGKEEERVAGGLFFAIGHTPNTAFLNGQLRLHGNGYIVVEPGTTKTNVQGVFAAGDVQDHVYRQAVTAAGTGCMAALEVERWLGHQGDESS
ncbi:thioredoxin-disulfide reductase [Simkania negevensis]|uniref:Thioredoxin reductase n=1 Tax=Simkania negevensis TaxID=83561 RepID=A0ABS3ASE6_9BACT|nr:thioredoxin-disulfide reductase [Simkania negevensis]